MKVFTTAAVLAVAVACVSASVAQVKSDVAAIDAAVKDLNNKLWASSINYSSALAIHNAAQALDKKIQQGTNDTKSNTEVVTEATAKAFIKTLTATEKVTKNATDRLVAIKPQFDKLGVSNIAKQDLAALKPDVAAFGSALVSAAPAAQSSAAAALAKKFNADLTKAAKAYGA